MLQVEQTTLSYYGYSTVLWIFNESSLTVSCCFTVKNQAPHKLNQVFVINKSHKQIN